MGVHTEIMEEANIARSEYLAALRKEQPIEELTRKAKKSERRKGKLWTQEQVDLNVAQGMRLISKILLD